MEVLYAWTFGCAMCMMLLLLLSNAEHQGICDALMPMQRHHACAAPDTCGGKAKMYQYMFAGKASSRNTTGAASF
jgi:hypothetical protein